MVHAVHVTALHRAFAHLSATQTRPAYACAAAPKLKRDKAAPAKAQTARKFFTDDGHDPAAWKTSTDEQRQPYKNAAEMDKSRYAEAMAAYTPSPGWLDAKAFVEAARLACEVAQPTAPAVQHSTAPVMQHCVRCCENFDVVRRAFCCVNSSATGRAAPAPAPPRRARGPLQNLISSCTPETLAMTMPCPALSLGLHCKT